MKKGMRLDKKLKMKHSKTKNQSNEISLPPINQSSKLKIELKSRSKEKKQSYLQNLKSKLEILTRRNKQNHGSHERKKSVQLQESLSSKQKNINRNINRRPVLHKNEEKENIENLRQNQFPNRRTVVYRRQFHLQDQESSECQVKMLFNSIQDQLKCPQLSPHRKDPPPQIRSYSLANILAKSQLLRRSPSALASPREQLFLRKTNANKDVTSMIGTIGTEMNRLDEFLGKNQNSIKAYLNQKMHSFNIQYFYLLKSPNKAASQ